MNFIALFLQQQSCKRSAGSRADESLTNAMVVIQHGRDAIKPESIKAIVFNPHPQIRQEESQDFPAKKTPAYFIKLSKPWDQLEFFIPRLHMFITLQLKYLYTSTCICCACTACFTILMTSSPFFISLSLKKFVSKSLPFYCTKS